MRRGPELRDEVERLLSALDESGEFLEPDPGSHDGPFGGPRIGPYVVLDRAGRGGMGVVYHAVRETTTGRKWRSRWSKPARESDFLIARFRLERQALALAQSPQHRAPAGRRNRRPMDGLIW